MANPADGKQYTDFFEAFCHHFDCPSDSYEKRAFFMAVPAWKRPAIWVLYHTSPDLFDLDLDIIEELGHTRTRDDFSGVLDEFHNAMRVNRSSLKTKFGMRMQGSRLMDIRDELNDLIAPSANRRKPSRSSSPSSPPSSPAPASQPAAARSPLGAAQPPRAAIVPTGSRALMVRKVRQTHAAVTAGVPLAKALDESGLEEAQFLELLAEGAVENPAFAWLRDQLLRERRLQDAEQEITRLNRAVADQSREIAELRDRLSSK